VHRQTVIEESTLATTKAPTGSRPNILVIWGDDIGITNLSCYSDGLMGYRTPNIDRIANEGMRFTDSYGEQSCTAGRSSFITGQSVFRTGLSKVGMPGVDVGLHLDRGVVLPGAVGVRPALDPVGPPAGGGSGHRGRPGVQTWVGAGHRQHVLGAIGVGEHHRGVDGVVALAEDGGGDLELLVDHRLGGAGAVVDAGPDVEHGDAADRLLGGGGGRGNRHNDEPTGELRGGTLPAASRISDRS